MRPMNRPVVLDLDGSLLKVDSLWELAVYGIRQDWKHSGGLVASAIRGKVALKEFVATFAHGGFAQLPANPHVLELLNRARSEGREVVLATASSQRVAREADRIFGPFSELIASGEGINLAGRKKAQVLVDRFGEKGFDYVGNAKADFHVFAVAHTAYLVSNDNGLRRRLQQQHSDSHLIGNSAGGLHSLLRLMRPTQWVKNLLLFVPALAAGHYDGSLLLAMLLGVVVFSAVASGLYIVNDILDIHDDRTHPEKKYRPIAKGEVSIPQAAGLAIVLLLAGGLGGWFLGPPLFVLFLGGYGFLSLGYSLWLKRVVLLDVFVLASLYGIRILAGSVLASVALGAWLLSFSFFAFLALALVKRFVEISGAGLKDLALVRGRGYRPGDKDIVGSAGVGAGLASAVLLALYIESQMADVFLDVVGLNGLSVPLWLFWILRVWLLAARGLMHSDPVLFAVKDPTSLVIGSALVALLAVDTG